MLEFPVSYTSLLETGYHYRQSNYYRQLTVVDNTVSEKPVFSDISYLQTDFP